MNDLSAFNNGRTTVYDLTSGAADCAQMDLRSVCGALLFLLAVIAISFSPARPLLLLLIGPLSLLTTRLSYGRYSFKRIGRRGIFNLLIVSILCTGMVLSGFICFIIPGVFLGAVLMFAQPLVVYRGSGVFSAIGGSIKLFTVRPDLALAIWLYTVMISAYGLLTFFGIFNELPRALRLRRRLFFDLVSSGRGTRFL